MPWFLIIIINMFFVGILFGFLPVHIHNLGYNAFQSGLLVAITAISYLLVQPLAGWLADKMNAKVTVCVGMLLSCLATATIPFVAGTPLIIVCITAGIGIGTVWTNTDTLVSKLAKKNQMGATMGIAGSFKEFGDMAGPLIMGAVSQTWGLQWGFILCALIGLIALVIALTTTKKITT